MLQNENRALEIIRDLLDHERNQAMEKIKAADMRLGDIVTTFDGPFNTSVVARVTDDCVTLQRPYIRPSDVAYGNQVTCLTGIETFSLWTTSSVEYVCWQRGEVK